MMAIGVRGRRVDVRFDHQDNLSWTIIIDRKVLGMTKDPVAALAKYYADLKK
jgi:hypothetical protein